MPFCNQCGGEVPADVRFCQHCGSPIDQTSVESIEVQPVQERRSSGVKRFFVWSGIGCGGLLVLIIACSIILSITTSSSSPEESGEPSITYFKERLDAGADCRELFDIRNSFDSKSPYIEEMNNDLIFVGCHTSGSTRESPSKPTATPVREAVATQSAPPTSPDSSDSFTVREYRIYRMILDTPLSVPENEAMRQADAKYGASSDEVRVIFDKVQRLLSRNDWFGPTEVEIRRASDWNGERR